jgi:hypothetical protein
MRRVHLFEFHDLEWFPAIFRDALTEWLRLLWEHADACKALAPILGTVLHESHATQVVDLCSGAGGPLIGIQRELEDTRGNVPLKAIVTDKFPNARKLEALQRNSRGMIEARLTSVDATSVPRDLNGFRTLFNSFHHFPPAQACQILRDAYEARQPIGVFEIPNRKPFGIAFSFFASFLAVLLWMPRMRPRKLAWWIFTYLVPIIPLTVAWDSWVSHLRAYTPQELLQMTCDFSDSYGWEIRNIELQNGKFTVTCLIGLPRQRVKSGHPRLAALTVSALISESPAETVRETEKIDSFA